MSFERALDDALDRQGIGTVEVESGGRRAEIEVVDAGRIGVRVQRVKVTRGSDRPVDEVAARLPERLRSLPDRMEPVEVDPGLGGAVLRSKPEEIRHREFFQIDVRGTRDVEVRRYRADEDGERKPADWALTREQLGRLVDELADDKE